MARPNPSTRETVQRPLDPPQNAGTEVPGGVYLCQVSETVSCGACCGLYNVADPSREAITAMLARRTTLFSRIPREIEAILDFGARTGDQDGRQRPYPDFHHCPYLGLVGENRTRVGCLLHPLGQGNRGVDWRGLSHYGGMACRVYFCPATRRLEARYKQVLRAAWTDDWHAFGLMASERYLVAALLHLLEARLGRLLDPAVIAGAPAQRQAMGRLLRIKLDWPHGRGGHLCHDFFADRRRPSPGARGDKAPDGAYDVVLGELETDPGAAAARAALDRRLAAAARDLR
jgi:hypothetical protein